jgi:cell wall-associated protease
MKRLLYLIFVIPVVLFGQPNVPLDWFHLCPEKDGFRGLSTERAYELLKDRPSQTVIVAVIDSGVDIEHEDLKDNIWINPGEIAESGRDDDGNGYIDDLHGWNFIGGPDQDVINDNLEITRLYRKFRDKYSHLNPLELNRRDIMKYAEYLTYKRAYEEGKERSLENYEGFREFRDRLVRSIDMVLLALDDRPVTLDNLRQIDTEGNFDVSFGIAIIENLLEDYAAEDFDFLKNELLGSLDDGVDYYHSRYHYFFNVDFDPRWKVGDNYEDSSERFYGNNRVSGEFSEHGTHVAGIIGAVRGNGIGIDGVASNVRIMSIRTVPNGDERDKDVANAIRYAVDNGAKVINMSFGKGYSWDKAVVDEAIRHAEKNDVLLIHAAGNSAQNNDYSDNFPNPVFERRKFLGPRQARNWIEVGALSYGSPPEMVASFSNFGAQSVDLFAPGNFIYSTVPENGYNDHQGTSMAAPMVAGVAALIRSYFPNLTARQVREILLDSAIREDVQVYRPGDRELVPFSSLSRTGGYLNAYRAVQLALEVSK